MKENLITFSRTSQAIQGEQILLKEGLSVKVMPLPSRIRAGCGILLRIRPDEFQRALQLLRDAGITGMSFYIKENQEIKEIQV